MENYISELKKQIDEERRVLRTYDFQFQHPCFTAFWG